MASGRCRSQRRLPPLTMKEGTHHARPRATYWQVGLVRLGLRTRSTIKQLSLSTCRTCISAHLLVELFSQARHSATTCCDTHAEPSWISLRATHTHTQSTVKGSAPAMSSQWTNRSAPQQVKGNPSRRFRTQGQLHGCRWGNNKHLSTNSNSRAQPTQAGRKPKAFGARRLAQPPEASWSLGCDLGSSSSVSPAKSSQIDAQSPVQSHCAASLVKGK